MFLGLLFYAHATTQTSFTNKRNPKINDLEPHSAQATSMKNIITKLKENKHRKRTYCSHCRRGNWRCGRRSCRWTCCYWQGASEGTGRRWSWSFRWIQCTPQELPFHETRTRRSETSAPWMRIWIECWVGFWSSIVARERSGNSFLVVMVSRFCSIQHPNRNSSLSQTHTLSLGFVGRKRKRKEKRGFRKAVRNRGRKWS